MVHQDNSLRRRSKQRRKKAGIDTDNSFTLSAEANDVIKILTDVLQRTQNPYPKEMIVCEVIDKLDKISRYFYSDFVK